MRITYQNKREELNYLYESQTKELQRAATLDQGQKDVELIVQRHMLDIDDWMISCNKQINQFRKNQYQQFWGKVFSNSFGSMSGPTSHSNISEEAKSQEQSSKRGDGSEGEDTGDLIKFKSQIGVINKLNVTILVAQNLKEDEVLNINEFRRVKKIKDKMPCNLIIATFDDNEDRAKMDKFMNLTEMTPIENNFPVKLQLPQRCLENLMVSNEFVFGNFPQQVRDTFDQLIMGAANCKDPNLVQDQDLIITQHCQISSYILKENEEIVQPTLSASLDHYNLHRCYNVIGMVHSKKTTDCTQYQQILHKFLKLVEHEFAGQIDSKPVIVIPMDFLTMLNIQSKSSSSSQSSQNLTQSTAASNDGDDALSEIISTIVMTLKQVIYAMASEDMTSSNGINIGAHS